MDALPDLAESLATGHNLATMISQLRTARADLTTPAHHEPPPELGTLLGAPPEPGEPTYFGAATPEGLATPDAYEDGLGPDLTGRL